MKVRFFIILTSDTTYEFWIPRKDDEFCKKLKIKPKWIVKSFESECVHLEDLKK